MTKKEHIAICQSGLKTAKENVKWWEEALKEAQTRTPKTKRKLKMK